MSSSVNWSNAPVARRKTRKPRMAVPGVSANLFASHNYYVNARYQARLQASIQQAWVDDATRKSLHGMMTTGNAFWIDTIARIQDTDTDLSLESAFRDAASLSNPPLIVAILYNLPNRDCHASASNGELCCQYDSTWMHPRVHRTARV